MKISGSENNKVFIALSGEDADILLNLLRWVMFEDTPIETQSETYQLATALLNGIEEVF